MYDVVRDKYRESDARSPTMTTTTTTPTRDRLETALRTWVGLGVLGRHVPAVLKTFDELEGDDAVRLPALLVCIDRATLYPALSKAIMKSLVTELS
jgi:hypothetical protein